MPADWELFPAGEAPALGCLAIAPSRDAAEPDIAFIVAPTERVMRNLLRMLPRGRQFMLYTSGNWCERLIREFFSVEACGEGTGHCWARGTKRGFAGSSVSPLSSVTGKKNMVLEEFRRLDSLKARLEEGRIVLEGALCVARAIRDGLPVEAILHTPACAENAEEAGIIKSAEKEKIRCYAASAGLIASVTDVRPVPRLLAIAHVALPSSHELHLPAQGVILLVDEVSNPDNLGMVLRTADAAGTEAVVVLGNGASPFHKNCLRSARGAVGRIPLFRCSDAAAFLSELRRQGFHVVGSSARQSKSLYDADLPSPMALVVGSESEGIGPEVLSYCGETVRIPMAPGQSSLNVAVAAGVLLFEWRRRNRPFLLA